ncbi:MAG: universal stress protein, partial [Planctomycetes bacterium]|nr:universal stress protein [Planctomycetota bacterium]
ATATKYALELAKLHKAEVTGVTDVDIAKLMKVGPVPIGGGAAAASLAEHRIHVTEEHVEQAIADFEHACANSGMIHCVDRETGDPFDRLIALWRYHDLTIAGLRGLFEYGVVEKPDDVLIRLISEGVRPILAVPKAYRPIRKVLVAYNGSMESAKALKQFVQMDLWPDIALQIVCFDMTPRESETLLADASSYCHSHGLAAQTQHVEGGPREHLLECAQQGEADLIVLGSTSRARILKRLLGDTVLHCLRNADVPLFLTQ